MSLGVPGRDLPPIPGGVEFFPQEDWVEPGYPMTGPSFPSPGDIILMIIHYPGGGRAETTHAGMLDRMRRMQRDYVDNRGYSLGYGVVSPPFGGIYEGRGLRLRNAANSGKKVSGNANHWSVSVQLNVTGQNAGTDKQIRDIAFWIGYLRDLGMHVVIDIHMTIDYTACPGSGIIPQVEAGMFEPDRWGYPGIGNEPEPEPEPEPPEPEGPRMIPLPHQRHYDSRLVAPLVAGDYTFGPFAEQGVLDAATGVLLAVTATEAGAAGWFTEAGSSASFLNFVPNDTRNSTSLFELDAGGRINLGVGLPENESVHIILDVQGYTL